jgi:hypothetical protein
LGLAACPGPGAGRRGAPSSEPPDAALVRAAGGGAALVLVARPQRFAGSEPARAALAALLQGDVLPRQLRRPVREALLAGSPWAALGAFRELLVRGGAAILARAPRRLG